MLCSLRPARIFSLSCLPWQFHGVLALCLLLPPGVAAAALPPPSTATVLTISPDGNIAAGTLVTLKAVVASGGQAVSLGQIIFVMRMRPIAKTSTYSARHR
jgi:hypothetical protein